MKLKNNLIMTTLIIVLLFAFVSDIFANDYLTLKSKYISTIDKNQKIVLGLELLRIGIDSATIESLPIVNQVIRYAEEQKDFKNLAEAKLISSTLLRYQRELPAALHELEEAENIFHQINDQTHLAEIYRSRGEIYRAMGEYGKALSWLKKAERKFAFNNDFHGLAKTYNRFAAVYYEQYRGTEKNYIDSVIHYSELSMLYGEKKHDFSLAVASYNILGALYKAIGNNKLAEKNLLLAASIAKSNQLYVDLPVIYYNISRLKYSMNQTDLAIRYADTAYNKSKIHSQPQYGYLSLMLLSGMYKSKKDYQKALMYLESAHNEYGSIKATDIKSLRFQIEEKYKNDKELIAHAKEGDIAVYKNTFLILFIIAILIVAFLLVFLFAQQKNANVSLAESNALYLKQTEALQTANATKDKFFSIIAHDLRSPLGSLMGLTRVMHEQMDKFSRVELKENAQMVFESVVNIYKLVQNLLDWSRIQRGVLKFNPALVDLNEIVNTAIQMNKGNAETKDIRVDYTNQEFEPVLADSNILTTILRNLISNSVKFTPRGGVITVELNKSDNDIFEFSVKDTGVGISDKRIDKLFKIEEKVSTVGTEGEPSTGLGLPLCKELVTLHGGQINVCSKENSGSCFNFTIPAEYE